MNRIWTALILSLFLTSCGNVGEIDEESVSTDANTYAKEYVERLSSGDADYCINQLDSRYQTEDAKKFLRELAEVLSTRNVKNSAVTNYRVTTIYTDNQVKNYELGYEYEYDGLWAYYTFQLHEENGRFTVVGFNANQSDNSLRNLHQFNFDDKGFIHYIFLLFACLIPGLILVSFVVMLKTPMKKKWLWGLFILVGVVAFNLNWTDGQVGMQFLKIKLFGVGVTKAGILAPWIISYAIPLGAIAFWFKRKDILRQQHLEKLIEAEKEKK